MAGETAAAGAPLPFLVSVLTPRPVGRMTLRSADPLVFPDVDFGYLGSAEDRGALRDAVRATAALLDVAPMALESDDTLDRWIRENLGTAQHTCGTVPMGPEGGADAVVDQYGRVHGIRGLRVADTSILPDAPQRGPAATAVLIGEVIADGIRRDLP
jgi:choline dehydrogenase-like flavoprotein